MKLILLVCLSTFTGRHALAQDSETDTLIPQSVIQRVEYRPITLKPHPFLLPISRASVRGSYPLELSFSKTTHILFPSKIIEFDAGNETIMAMVPETIANVLRIKSDSRGFHGETNMTVFTEDGGVYSFLVRYNENPEVFTLDMAGNSETDSRTALQLGIGGNEIRETNPLILPEGIQPGIQLAASSRKALEEKSFIRHVGARKNGLQVLVRGLYLDQRKVLYLKLEIRNQSYLPYQIDFIKFFVRDINRVKRMAVQEEELPVLATYPENISHLDGYQKIEGMVALPLPPLADGKILEMELYEKKGGRHLNVSISNETVLQAKPL